MILTGEWSVGGMVLTGEWSVGGMILTGEQKYWDRKKKGSQFHFVSQSDTHCPRIEPGSPRGEAGL